MKKIWFMIVILAVACMLYGCNSDKVLLNDKIKPDDIDKIQIMLAMGNPEYGADSKIITDKDEIREIVDAFNNAAIGSEVKNSDIHVSTPSSYYFYSGNSLIHQFSFNSNDSMRIWRNQKCYYVEYPDKSPYELYQKSNAEIIIVDEELNELKNTQ